MSKRAVGERYCLIDALRGLAVLGMIGYHLCYDIFVVFGVDATFPRWTGSVIWERLVCFTFIIVSGISLNFARHGYKRGLIVNLCGFLITAVTVLFMPSEAIWFGVLNLLGCSMMMAFAVRDSLNKLRPAVGMGISAVIFALLYKLPEGYLGLFALRLIKLPEWLYGCRYLAFIGLPSKDFVSSDYFPLLPWFFLFLFGFFLWRFIEEKGRSGLFRREVPVLGLIGRYSLWIYMAHQPILYGICRLIFVGF